MKTAELIEALEKRFPLAYQESYDNCGLQVGNLYDELKGVLITLDVDERVMAEAESLGMNFIIAHHPVIFNPIKKLTGNTLSERLVALAIQKGIHLYVMHTNLDNGYSGLNHALATQLGIVQQRVLKPGIGKLFKIITYCPIDHFEVVREAMFSAGAGKTGHYDSCGFQSVGEGTFRPLKGSDPFVGEFGVLHTERELRLEMVVPSYLLAGVVDAMVKSHPYEEVAYDVIGLHNSDGHIGSGVYGKLENPMSGKDFIGRVKSVLGCQMVKSSCFREKVIRTAAVCGGSGAFLIHDAIRVGVDAFVTADVKYHQFLEASEKLLMIDAGHYETEKVMTEMIYHEIRIKFPNFACQISGSSENPVKYS